MHRKFLVVFLFFFTLGCLYAQKHTISGYVTDYDNGEVLISASVYDHQSHSGCVTNAYGFYSLTLPNGLVDLQISSGGYITKKVQFVLQKDTAVNIRLKDVLELKEVIVNATRRDLGVEGTQMSAIDVPIAQIKTIPTLFGEVDVLKALQLLPGVKGGVEGTTGFYVRGGGPDENLILLDGVPVYNANHVFGLFSVFNADAIKNVTLYKGSFPARFGGRMSSVVDVRMKDGDFQQYHGDFSIGLISSKLNVEGPIIKNKTSFNFSARRTYADILAAPFVSALSEGGTGSMAAYFYDLNLKVNHKVSDKDRLFLSTYLGDDVMGVGFKTDESTTSDGDLQIQKEKVNFNWGNIIAALRWNHIVNNKLFVNTTAAFTRYRYDLGVGFENSTKSAGVVKTDYMKAGFNSGIVDYSLKADFDYAPAPNHEIKFGGGYTNHTFRPKNSWSKQQMNLNNTVSVIDTVIGEKDIYAQETELYFEDNYTINSYLKANFGCHQSFFFVRGKSYQSFQPRLGLRYLVNDKLSFKAGYAKMSQYIHLLSSSNISLPTDLWVPVTDNVKPMNSDQYSLGAFYSLPNIAELSLETYYKSMNNLIEYKDGASFMGSTTGWERKINMGRGWAYGVELLLQRSFGATTGWVGYTWSKAERQFDRPGQEINQGKVFPAKYDRRHDVSIVVSHKFSKKFDASATWVYSTGNCGTLSLQRYASDGKSDNQFNYSSTLDYLPTRNNYRLPAYNRLDLGVNFHKQLKHGIRTWNISVYNVYNQMNPFMIYPGSSNGIMQLKQISLLPILPSVSYSYKF